MFTVVVTQGLSCKRVDTSAVEILEPGEPERLQPYQAQPHQLLVRRMEGDFKKLGRAMNISVDELVIEEGVIAF